MVRSPSVDADVLGGWREVHSRRPAAEAAGLITVRTGTKAGKPAITWARDQDAITAASRLDGLYALATNLPDHDDGSPLTAADVLKTYEDQQIVERPAKAHRAGPGRERNDRNNSEYPRRR